MKLLPIIVQSMSLDFIVRQWLKLLRETSGYKKDQSSLQDARTISEIKNLKTFRP